MSLFFQKFWYNFRILTSHKVFTVCSSVWKGEESESRPINRRGDVTLTALVGVRTSRAPLTEGPRLVSVFPPASSSPAAQINALLPKQRKYLWAAIKSEIIMRPLSQNMNLADSWFTRYHELLVKEVEPRIPPLRSRFHRGYTQTSRPPAVFWEELKHVTSDWFCPLNPI